MSKHRIFAISAAALLLTGCGTKSTDSTAPAAEKQQESNAADVLPPEEKSMVTLGDSISFGYGMEDIDNQRYSALLKQKMEADDGCIWYDYNYALSGDDSSALLYKLQAGHALRLPSADVIVICIGANNLLGVYSQYISEKAGDLTLDPETITEEQISEIQAQIESDLQDQEQAEEMFQSMIDKNLTQLESDLEEIYQYIRERNENADVYILNIYNPYLPDTESGMMADDAAFYTFASDNIARANSIIAGLTAAHEDLIPVDIAAAFAACDTPPVIGAADYAISEEQTLDYYDPHPTAEGQQLIADTVFAAMKAHK